MISSCGIDEEEVVAVEGDDSCEPVMVVNGVGALPILVVSASEILHLNLQWQGR